MFHGKNELLYDKDFLKDARALPTTQQNKLADLLEIFQDQPFHPLLHTKPLGAPLQGMFSFRVTRGYRVGFKFDTSHTIRLLATGHRNTFYKKLRRKK